MENSVEALPDRRQDAFRVDLRAFSNVVMDLLSRIKNDSKETVLKPAQPSPSTIWTVPERRRVVMGTADLCSRMYDKRDLPPLFENEEDSSTRPGVKYDERKVKTPSLKNHVTYPDSVHSNDVDSGLGGSVHCPNLEEHKAKANIDTPGCRHTLYDFAESDCYSILGAYIQRYKTLSSETPDFISLPESDADEVR